MATKTQNEINSDSLGFKIRDAIFDDCDDIFDLIKKLAKYERSPEKASLSVNDLKRDGFGNKNPLFHCKVAETENKRLVGYVFYVFHYSTCNGKIIHLEDFYVEPEFRGSGIGCALFSSLAQETIKTGCAYFNFDVLAWNEPSIKFYKNRGAKNLSDTDHWMFYRLPAHEIVRVATRNNE